MTLPGIRPTFFILFLAAVSLMLTALYFEYVLKQIPCPLCITIRVCVILGGLVALSAFLQNSNGYARRLYAVLGAVFAATGAGVAGRMLWLQNLPADQVPACGPDLTYMLDNFPLLEALDILFRGDGNCAEVTWRFMSLSIAGWTFVACAGLVLVNLWQGLRRSPASSGWLN